MIMPQVMDIRVPDRLPFLEAICWDLRNIRDLNQEEMLNRYERGIPYDKALADLEGEERLFVKELAKNKGSWLQLDV